MTQQKKNTWPSLFFSFLSVEMGENRKWLWQDLEVCKKKLKTWMNRSVDEIISSMNISTFCWYKLHLTTHCGTGRTGEESNKELSVFSIFVTLCLSHYLSCWFHFRGQWQIVSLSPLCSFLHSARNHSHGGSNKVKWSQQIMQSGHEVNCQCSLAATPVMASCLPDS